MVHGVYKPEEDSLRLLPEDTWIDAGDYRGIDTKTLKYSMSIIIKSYCILAMSFEVLQTRKHCFLTIFHESGQATLFSKGAETFFVFGNWTNQEILFPSYVSSKVKNLAGNTKQNASKNDITD